MFDTTNNQVRRVMTPIGVGRLCGWNPDKEEHYLVLIKKEDCKEPIAGSHILKWFKAEELNEL